MAAFPVAVPIGDRLESSLVCEAVTTAEHFLALQGEWTELAAQCRRPTPFTGWDFAVEWWRHFVLKPVGRATGRFRIIVVRDSDDRVVAIVPLFEELTKGRAGVGLRLQPFGRSYSFEAMSDEPIALFHHQHEQAALAAVKAHLTERAGPWDVAVLRASLFAPNVSPWRVKRRAAEVERQVDGPMSIRLPSSWRAYRAGLSKSMRDNLAYYRRRLDREVGAWGIQAARSPAEVAMATEALIALHRERSRSTRGRAHCDHIPTAVHAEFMRHWFQRLARRGAITLMVLETPEGIRAAQAFVEGPGCACVYYSGCDEHVSRFSALTLITAAWLQMSIARGLTDVLFPPGSAAWSARWGASSSIAAGEASIYAMTVRALWRGMARRWSSSHRGD